MKGIPNWIVYTFLRLVMFAVPLAILLLLQITWWIACVAAAIIGLCLSYIFLRSPRDRMSSDIYRARHPDGHERERASRRHESDDEVEDAAVDQADAGRSSRWVAADDSEDESEHRPVAGDPRSEGERGA